MPMAFTLSLYLIPLLLVALLSIVILIYLQGRRDIPGVKAFTVLMASLFVWSVFEALVVGFTSIEAMKLCDQITYFGIAIVPPSWLVFAAQYTGHKSAFDRRVIAALYVIPTLTILLIFSPYKTLIWESYGMFIHKGVHLSLKEYGIWFWLQTGYAYVMLISGVAILLNHTTFSSSLFIRQKIILVGGLVLPWIGNVATRVMGVEHTVIDLTIVAFAFTCVAVLYGLFEYNLMDIVPLAQRSIFDNLSDAFIVVDSRGKILESNTRAKEYYHQESFQFGSPLLPLLDGHPALVDAMVKLPVSREPVQIIEQVGNLYYESTATPLIHGDEYLGASIQTRDVSLRIVAEEKVKAYNEMLTLINKILRHDVANNISIAMLSLGAMEGAPSDLMDKAQKALYRSKDLIARMKEYESVLNLSTAPRYERVRDLIADIGDSYPSLAIDIDGESTLLADSSLYSVIENLVRNASVHGGADHIQVSLSETPYYSIIEVADNGAGMSKIALEHAFEEGFSYGRNKGTGIGLYLVHKLVENIGGTITVENNIPHGVRAIIKIKKEKDS